MGFPTWEVLRFDGESVREELVANWSDIMLVDVDLDGTVEILGEEINHVNCYYCGLSSRSFSLYRWNGTEMTAVWPETLPAGSASDAAVAANNRAAELAGAERWAEALAVVDGDRALVAESAVFRRNASLIGLNAAASDGDRFSEDTLLHYVFAGLWAEAVDIFRHKPILPDFFTTPPPYMGKYMMKLQQVRHAAAVDGGLRRHDCGPYGDARPARDRVPPRLVRLSPSRLGRLRRTRRPGATRRRNRNSGT